MAGRLDGKVAIVTGGASGIGERTVELFVEQGAKVLVADLQDDKGERLAERLGKAAAYQRTDVTSEADVAAAVAAAVKRFGRLDCMFNNAGFPGVTGKITEIPVEGFDTTVAVLLKGVFLGIKHAGQVMRKQGSGSIISTASVAGIGAGFGPHIYSAAKAAVIHLTKSVSVELGEDGVRVNCICPGGIATPIFGKAMGMATQVADRTVEVMKQVLPMMQAIKRAGLPEDIAQAALWLASDESSFVNGHALVVDGGLTSGRPWSQQETNRKQLQALLGSLPQN